MNITTSHPEYHAQIGQFLKSDPKYKLVLSKIVTTDQEGNNSILTSVSENLLELTNFARQIIFWIIMIFIIGGALIILNALQITIFNRKKEIAVMKLVGASHWFIRLPFIIESIIYGLLAVAISFVMLLVLSKKIQIQETNLFSYYSDIKFYKIFIVETIATITLSIMSSMAAVHEYLNKQLLDH
ncbi:FtsX-like permease family protein [Candidatus Peregrinibacteria bacterium]|nr:FtsX-like permease family protein [Candidatus Peregrinibacteria bacterium]